MTAGSDWEYWAWVICYRNWALNMGQSLYAEDTCQSDTVTSINNNMKWNINNINEKQFEKLLYTNETPNPDLIIRTGGQKRISNFMLWQSAYSEMYFTSKLWPDFNKRDVSKALNDFKKRNRNYGKIN